MRRLKKLMCDNCGSTDLQMVIIMVIAFAAGAILLAAVFGAFDDLFASGTSDKIHDIMGQ